MAKIVLDGVTYVPEAEQVIAGDIKICVLDNGFVYVGRTETCDDIVKIHGARCIVRWGTKDHLGGLVYGPTENTKLGGVCDVSCIAARVSHYVEVSQDGWLDNAG
jgi:hypothetical protein